jgi:outer membrane protein OmpA-like peptidoglycan-associated protein
MSRLTFTSSRIEEPDREPEYWLSFSDLMAGLLMVFALMLLAALYNYQSGVDGIREILMIREQVIEELKSEFDDGPGAVVHVEDNGSVRFLDNVLFSQGSAVVSPEGRTQLASFANSYLSVLLGNPTFQEQLRAIVIEGHTNSDGSYELNLDLSQARAFAVMVALLEEAGEYRAVMEALVSANGRSYSDLLYLDEGQTFEDKDGSRRIEIHFRLNDDELLRQILDQVAGGPAVQ